MYEDQYSLFAPAIKKPAKPFGIVFLDKIFQLIVELPEISTTQKELYWSKLLNISNESQVEDVQSIQLKVDKAPDMEGKLAILNNTKGDRAKQLVSEQIVNSISIQKEEKILEHRLQKFIDLIEPNPRVMKRLINDVSTVKAMTILYNQRVDEDQLILWTILKQDYPTLAEYLWEEPELIKTILTAKTLNDKFTTLLKKKEVKNLFEYKIGGKIVKLDMEFLQAMKFQSP